MEHVGLERLTDVDTGGCDATMSRRFPIDMKADTCYRLASVLI